MINPKKYLDVINEAATILCATNEIPSNVDAGEKLREFAKALESQEFRTFHKLGMQKREHQRIAKEIAVTFASIEKPSYYSEPFEPHQWVVNAIESALDSVVDAEQTEATVAVHTTVENECHKAWNNYFFKTAATISYPHWRSAWMECYHRLAAEGALK